MNEKQPFYILPENVSRTLGKDAQRNNILAAKIVSEIIKTTLGPKGMDKMLVDSAGNIIVTNDGVTILEEMEIDHPAAKMMVEIARTQENEVGDGTTTAALLAGKLLEHAEFLLDKKIHPTLIIQGYRKASDRALSILNDLAMTVNDKKTLQSIAMTAMTGKGAEGYKEKLADLVVKSVDQVANLKDVFIEDITLLKIIGSSIERSELIQGIVIEKEKTSIDMPSCVKTARILLIDVPLEVRNTEAETKVSVSTPEQFEHFLASEEKYLKNLASKIIESGANVVFCQKGIDDVAQYYLAKAGILACRRISKSIMEKLSRATTGKIISNLNDISSMQLGKAEIVEEVKFGEETFIYLKNCGNPKTATLILRGSTSHVTDEIERAVKDGLGDVIAALKSGKIVAGGGAVEVELAKQLRTFARTLGGREQLAIEEFAHALESIPETLAENAGLDPVEILTELKKRHEMGLINHGINLFVNKVEDTIQAGIIEPLKVKAQAITSATEVATLILRIDDTLISKSQKEQKSSDSYPDLE